MLPRFANPHFLANATRTVSRSELYTDPDEETETAAPDTNKEALLSLESILKRTLGDVLIPEPGRKKKRRKVDESEGQDGQKVDVVVEFRLLSREPKAVSLVPPPPPTVKVMEPPSEDTEEEAKRRTSRAAQVAVDINWLLAESRRPTISCKKSVHPAPTPHLPERLKPSPHELAKDKLHYPIVEASPVQDKTEPGAGSTKRKSRHRRKKEQPPRPPPTFWRPMIEWGGKSAGYAMGYHNSRAVWSEGARWRPYQRDRMRRAVVVV
ncbi:hypothetical protein K474DRAFT_804409 [Panus rudis PR-1116 ss-1]|nr:hypothetical protein K474DRAFT_804409 [Panus rudis PR-1116 ss-1]